MWLLTNLRVQPWQACESRWALKMELAQEWHLAHLKVSPSGCRHPSSPPRAQDKPQHGGEANGNAGCCGDATTVQKCIVQAGGPALCGCHTAGADAVALRLKLL